jgi:cytochrome c556
MRRVVAPALLTIAGALAATALAAEATPGSGPGWTGVTNPKDVITARQELMAHIEELMEPIDTLQVREVSHPEQLRLSAEVISAMLLAVPHLFPPTTNRYDPKAEEPETLALPGIWTDFGSFYELAAAAASAAESMAEAKGKQQLQTASLRLRASCDACHTLYLRPYSPPKVLPSDIDFDFDSALRQQ